MILNWKWSKHPIALVECILIRRYLIWRNSILRGFIFSIQAFSISFFLEMILNWLKFLRKLEQVDAYSFKCFNVFYMSQPKIQNGTYPPKLLKIWVLIDTHPVFLLLSVNLFFSQWIYVINFTRNFGTAELCTNKVKIIIIIAISNGNRTEWSQEPM